MKHHRLPYPLVCAAVVTGIILTGCSSQPNLQVRINQVGFRPAQEKTATIDVLSPEAEPCDVTIINTAGDTVWQGCASTTKLNPVSGKPRQIVDFSDLNEAGEYTLIVDNKISIVNCQLSITDRPYRELTRKALRAFYYQRASMDIVEPYAEGYERKGGHPDDHVLVHASAATDERPEGTVISCPGGWYDAGDYNKYIVNSGFTMGVWLMAYELNKPYFDTLCLNIPESIVNGKSSNRKCPDMLAEAMYNLRWMLMMQDTDGGVYHKLTEPDFEGFIRPDECSKPRYVVMKTTAATLDFAAAMALAARVYAPFEEAYPGFVAQATEAAKRAYAWAQANPAVYYDQPALNEQFSPAITTGAYDDFEVRDEFFWAATELYMLTKDRTYKAERLPTFKYNHAVWGRVSQLADLEWMMHPEEDGRFAMIREAEMLAYMRYDIRDAEKKSVHRSPYGNDERDFYWGCNSEGCCWRGIEFLYAYRLTGEEKYRINAERCLNYILGQNATGYCYVTGFGTKPACHPHHRLSYSHPKGTHPGFLVGGPNPMKQDAETDGVRYPKDVPADECYLDRQPSYASNEVTINWNVTLFALTAGLDALCCTPAESER
ncbi:MAG: glycoside hydrolase family 9 protein [Paludibacteraceae bacterium]|nr:glycoside hydrolase family 9 protein [Paludibacteraceae bacterium]